MSWSRRRTILALCAGAVLLALSACTGFFHTDVPVPTLLVAPAFRGAAGWEIWISVANMPDGGLAGIAFKGDAITTTDIDVDTLVAHAANRFLIWDFDFRSPYPEGALCATNPFDGVESGEILVLRFEATGPSPSIATGTKLSGSNRPTTMEGGVIARFFSYSALRPAMVSRT